MLIHDDCVNALKEFEENHFDALITDPPAGIGFMGKEWDKDKGGRDHWINWMQSIMEEVLRVLKPGAYGLVWALPRTSHWTAFACEKAGFEIRDIVNHIFGSGFPKSLDISKAIDKAAGAQREAKPITDVNGRVYHQKEQKMGWGNNCKIRQDFPEAVTREAKHWQGFGTALKPACEHWILVRKPLGEKTVAANVLKWGTGGLNIDASRIGNESGRFPSHLIFDEEAAQMLDEQSGILKKDIGGASRFFYIAKASKSDKGAENTHPTVKSTKLMEYLITMITPPNGKIIDPFMGSGSTGVAAKRLGFEFVGIEKDEEYFKIAEKRK